MEEQMKDMDNQLSKIEKPTTTKGKFSLEDYAIAFIYGMSLPQRTRFKEMLQQGIECGQSVAKNYEVDYNEFIQEVKRIMKVEDK